jgi:hypothetical protein
MTIRSQSRILKIALISALSCAMLLGSSQVICSAEEQAMQTALKKTILSLDKTRKTVFEQYFVTAGAQNTAASRDEALLFIAYLDSRITQYCKVLYMRGGLQSLDDLPCTSVGQGENGDPMFESVPDFSGQTSQEKVATLEEEFSAALGEFDDMLLKEQEKVATHIPRQRESGGGNQGRESAGSEGAPETGGDSGAREQLPGSRSGESDSEQGGASTAQGASSEGAGQGRTENSQMEPTRGTKEMSDDDDVVARQLREAAEQETDPEVKEKLWEEYRKYKEGTK